tara:strand:+ start:586 stop:1623 length:1038 start_codon:yes stop_codon:yes gene_type:complete
MEVVVDLQDLLKLAGISKPMPAPMIAMPDTTMHDSGSSCGCGDVSEDHHIPDPKDEFANATDHFHGRLNAVASDVDEYTRNNISGPKNTDPNSLGQYADNPLKEEDMHQRYKDFNEDFSVGVDLFKKAMGKTGMDFGLGGRISKGKDNKTKISPRMRVGKGPLSVDVSLDDISSFFKKKKQESVQETNHYAELDNSTKSDLSDMEKELMRQERMARKKMKPKKRSKSDKAYAELTKYMGEDTTLEADADSMQGPLSAQPEMNPSNIQTIINRMMPLVKAGLLNNEQLGTFRSAITQFEKGVKPGMEQRKVLADVLGKLLDVITNDLTLANRIKADLGKDTQPEAA